MLQQRVRGKNMPERKFASTGYRTHNHQVMSPTRSPLSHPCWAAVSWAGTVLWHAENLQSAKTDRLRSACEDCAGWSKSMFFANVLNFFFFFFLFPFFSSHKKMACPWRSKTVYSDQTARQCGQIAIYILHKEHKRSISEDIDLL